MRNWKVISLSLIMILAGATVSVRGGIPPAKGPGIYYLLMERDAAPTVTFTLSVPPGYSAGTPAPLVVALHYRGVVTPFFGSEMLRTLVAPALDSIHAVLVAPDCPADRWDDPDSEAAVLELIREIRRTYAIDPRKIVITGYSLGGIGTWYLAARHPDLFCAAIPMASSTDAATAQQIRNIPLYVIHSAADELLPADRIRVIVDSLRQRGISVEYVELPEVDHFDYPAFIGPLRQAAAWLEELWQQAE
jgi:predicted peptidase